MLFEMKKRRRNPRKEAHLISFLRLHMWSAPENEQPVVASPEKALPPLLVAGRRDEDARERKEKRFWVRLRGEVRKDGFAVAVAVDPWVAGELAGKEEEEDGSRRGRR